MASGFIDAFEFVRLGKSLSQDTPLSRFERLLSDLPEQAIGKQVWWSAQADRGPLAEPLIRLHVRTELELECERCLEPFTLQVESSAVLHVVETEEQLADADSVDQSDPDVIDPAADFEKVLGSRKFDLIEQVEDELILCVPYVPKHDVCPTKGPAGDVPEASEEKPSPFAMLAQLKSGAGGGK